MTAAISWEDAGSVAIPLLAALIAFGGVVVGSLLQRSSQREARWIEVRRVAYASYLGALRDLGNDSAQAVFHMWGSLRSQGDEKSRELADQSSAALRMSGKRFVQALGEVELVATPPLRRAARAARDAVNVDFQVRNDTFASDTDPKREPTMTITESGEAIEAARQVFQAAARKELGIPDDE